MMEVLDISGFADLESGGDESGFVPPDASDRHDAVLERMLQKVPASCIRIYLCRADGVQLSSNYRRWDAAWRKEPEYRGANWSWRPYFLSDLLQLQGPLRASVSRTYTDLESRLWVRTMAVAVTGGAMLFMDMADPNARQHERS